MNKGNQKVRRVRTETPATILYRSRYEQARHIERFGKGALTISRTRSHRFDFINRKEIKEARELNLSRYDQATQIYRHVESVFYYVV